jgi:hypothetical protein
MRVKKRLKLCASRHDCSEPKGSFDDLAGQGRCKASGRNALAEHP